MLSHPSISAPQAILGRAVIVLEGIALVGNPNYRIVMESYPFVARKLLSDGTPAFQRSLAEILYSKGDGRLQSQRLAVLLNSAQGAVADTGAFIDFDTVPEEGISLQQTVKFILSNGARSLRDKFLEPELVNGLDLLSRQARQEMNSCARRFSCSFVHAGLCVGAGDVGLLTWGWDALLRRLPAAHSARSRTPCRARRRSSPSSRRRRSRSSRCSFRRSPPPPPPPRRSPPSPPATVTAHPPPPPAARLRSPPLRCRSFAGPDLCSSLPRRRWRLLRRS